MADKKITPFEQAAAPRRAASQATTIEQSRAVAEVQGAIVLAQQRPRDIALAQAEMQRCCASPALADRAFWSFKRGGSTISGPSIHLARELARCWGNIDYGIAELDRDDYGGRSEMLAFAWDLETNARSESKFIVPHRRDRTGGTEDLTQLRDIYENNSNQGARRLREAIFAVLPVYFIDDAKDLCRETAKKIDDDRSLADRIADAAKAYAALGVEPAQLETYIGKLSKEWDADDIATLRVLHRSLKYRETTIDEAFPKAAPKQAENGGDSFTRAAAGEPAKKAQPKEAKPKAKEESDTGGMTGSDGGAAPTSSAADGSDPARWDNGPRSPLSGGEWPAWSEWALTTLKGRALDEQHAMMAAFTREFRTMRKIRASDWAQVVKLVPVIVA